MKHLMCAASSNNSDAPIIQDSSRNALINSRVRLVIKPSLIITLLVVIANSLVARWMNGAIQSVRIAFAVR